MTSSTRTADTQGDLRRYPLPRLLYYLYKKQLLGQLALTQPGGPAATIYFRSGVPVYTDLRIDADVLGHVLVERGIIREEHVQASVQQLRPNGPRQGQILLQMGALSPQQLIEGLRLQLLRKLVRLFAWHRATFALRSGEHSIGVEGEAAQVRADPLQVIYQGVRHAFDAERMQPELDKLRGFAIALPATFEQLGSRYALGDETKALISTLRQRALSLEQLCQASALGTLSTQVLVYTLWVTEALEVRALPGQEGAKAAAPSAVQQLVSRPLGGTPRQALGKESVPSIRALAESCTGEPAQDGIPVRIPPGEASSSRLAERDDSGVVSLPLGEGSSSRIPAREVSATPIPAREGSSTRMHVYEGSSGRMPVFPEAAGSKRPSTGGGYRAVGGNERPSTGSAHRVVAASTSGLSHADPATVVAQHQRIKKTYKRLNEENYYQLLEIAPDATIEQIREAYFRLVKEFHPDRLAALGLQELAAEAAEVFRAISEAHTTLVDKQRRAAYDEELKAGGSKKQEAHDAVAAELAFQKGMAQLRRKDFAAALEFFGDAYRLNPKEGEHLAYLAWVTFCNPKTEREAVLPKVKEQLMEAVQLAPKSAACRHFLGEIYVALGDERRATECFETVLDFQPQHVDAARYLRLFQMRKEKQPEKQPKKGLFDRLRKK